MFRCVPAHFNYEAGSNKMHVADAPGFWSTNLFFVVFNNTQMVAKVFCWWRRERCWNTFTPLAKSHCSEA